MTDVATVDRSADLKRIHKALIAAREALEEFTPGTIEATMKQGDDPVTAADLKVDEVLREILPQTGEGWLSEETKDDLSRLDCRRVWIVDPIDGTREFVQGIPEWCVSIGLTEDGRAVAGGILNPATGELYLGAEGLGVTLNGEPVSVSQRRGLEGASVLASRSEVKRGEWERFEGRGFTIMPMGSVAYKLARIAAGQNDATWTLVPKNEWDIAAGVALIHAAGGRARPTEGELSLNGRTTLLPGLLAAGGAKLYTAIEEVTGG